MYSNEADRTYQDIYDDFKMKKPFSLHGLNKNNSALHGFNDFNSISPLTAKLFNLNFHPLEVVSR